MYKLTTNPYGGECQTVIRLLDGACIPFDPDNTDYQQFLLDWKAGAEVLNPDGTPAPYVAPETP
jgi:hypothetical protein